MQYQTAEEFLAWARGKGLAPYKDSRMLGFAASKENERVWPAPSSPSELREFIETALAGLKTAHHPLYLWPRGWWNVVGNDDADEAGKRLAELIKPEHGDGAVACRMLEKDVVIEFLMWAFTKASSVFEDFFLVPETADFVVMTSHHRILHVEARDKAEIERFAAHMAQMGFALPDESPDMTFKHRHWMKKE